MVEINKRQKKNGNDIKTMRKAAKSKNKLKLLISIIQQNTCSLIASR